MSPRGNGTLEEGTAAALQRLAREHTGPRFAINDLLATLGDHSFGLLVLALALPNAVPGPMIPGFSVPFALGIAALGLQLALGLHAPRLPGWVRRLSLRRDRFLALIDRTQPILLRLEHWLRPRPSPLTEGAGERVIGLGLVALSAVLALPVPLGNTPVALSIMVIALGLLEGDGVALLVGLVAGLAAALWNAGMIFAGAELVTAATHANLHLH